MLDTPTMRLPLNKNKKAAWRGGFLIRKKSFIY